MIELNTDTINYINEFSELREKYNFAVCSKYLTSSLLSYTSPLAKQLSHYHAQRPFYCKLKSTITGYKQHILINRSGYFWLMPIIPGNFWCVHINKIIKISHNTDSKILNVYYINPEKKRMIKPLIFNSYDDIHYTLIRFAENIWSRYILEELNY